MSERSILRVRTVPHIHPDRREELMVEVLRDGVVVATIYGSREGLHIVSERLQDEDRNDPFWLKESDAMPVASMVLPLLKPGERCPWSEQPSLKHCPVCKGSHG